MATRPLPEDGLPRVTFEAGPVPAVSTLRTDVALFVGSVRRGPVGIPTRIDCWRAYEAVFGGLWTGAHTPYAVHGYFDNGGLIAYILRIAPKAVAASGGWVAWDGAGGFAPEALNHSRYTIRATSEGSWGNLLAVRPAFRRGPGGAPLLDFEVLLEGRVAERLQGIPAEALADSVAEHSSLIRIEPDTSAPLIPSASGEGPLSRRWTEVALASGSDGAPATRGDYEAAVETAVVEPEPAMIVLPDLHRQFDSDGVVAILLAATRQCDARLDRLVIADAPETVEDAAAAASWVARFGGDPAVHRAAAVYHPWLQVRDPLGTASEPLRTLPPSGHVAGAVSRSDREKGAYVTPANMTLSDTVDLSRRPGDTAQGEMNRLGINALRCQSGRGIVVWGGRMLRTDDATPRFLAHRRLITRLTRALRRAWEPMVFEPNDANLRLTIARSATTLLMEAFHANVLKGTSPEEAFRIDVGDRLNDAAAQESGRVICEISIAPAAPMEFIHFRVGINAEGTIEMIET
jgi:hypothetical protein